MFEKLPGIYRSSSTVERFFDRERNVLVYVAYSDRVLAGSPKNSISTVPIMGGTLSRLLKTSGASGGSFEIHPGTDDRIPRIHNLR